MSDTILTLMIRTQTGTTYFGFEDEEFGLVFEPSTPSKTIAWFRSWYDLQDKDKIPRNIRIPLNRGYAVFIDKPKQ